MPANTLPDPGMDPETSCPVVALVTTLSQVRLVDNETPTVVGCATSADSAYDEESLCDSKLVELFPINLREDSIINTETEYRYYHLYCEPTKDPHSHVGKNVISSKYSPVSVHILRLLISCITCRIRPPSAFASPEMDCFDSHSVSNSIDN
uniref:SFRICE_015143 n=1 Tax=Spodoptera frugiperda TaxID=7108 RepID=A0A2H1WRT3_SPOFR